MANITLWLLRIVHIGRTRKVSAIPRTHAITSRMIPLITLTPSVGASAARTSENIEAEPMPNTASANRLRRGGSGGAPGVGSAGRILGPLGAFGFPAIALARRRLALFGIVKYRHKGELGFAGHGGLLI